MAGVKAILILILVASSALAGSVYDKLAGLDTEGGRLAQGFQKAPPIRVVLENRLPPVPTVENMINRPGIFHARCARHPSPLPKSLRAGQERVSRSDPFFHSPSHRAQRRSDSAAIPPLHPALPGIPGLPPPDPPFDIETFEPIVPPWQAIREWIPDDDEEPSFDFFDQRPDSGKPVEIPREDGSILILDSD